MKIKKNINRNNKGKEIEDLKNKNEQLKLNEKIINDLNINIKSYEKETKELKIQLDSNKKEVKEMNL